ncbi:MAG: ParA family protein [Clostridia bacterium]|nr:ParA family protein [Clostridia bacterium]
MAKVISFANQTGGVGKTTSAINVAASLGVLGHRVLLIDLDPQGNSTSGIGVAKKELKISSKDILTGNSTAKEAILDTEFDNLWLIPTNISLAGVEFELYDLFEDGQLPYILKEGLKPIQDDFDYIIIDCPPSLGMLTINAFTASDGIIVPMQCEYYAMEGLSQLIGAIKGIKKKFNPELTITGILITMYNARFRLSSQVMADLKNYYADKIFDTCISRTVKLTEAAGYGEPVYYYEKNAKGSKQYLEVAKELCERI